MKSATLITYLLLLIVLHHIGSSIADEDSNKETITSQEASSFPSTNTLESYEPSLHPTTLSPSSILSVTTRIPSASTVTPSPTPSATVTSTDSAPTQLIDSCQNTQGWRFNHWVWEDEQLRCDDFRVQCDAQGNLGPANQHCCKCMGDGCAGLCKAEEYFKQPRAGPRSSLQDHTPESLPDGDDKGVYIFVFFIISAMSGALAVVPLCSKLLHERDHLSDTRRIMAIRRRQQRESSMPSMTEEDRSTDQYEQMLTMFRFQTVQVEKMNITEDTTIREDLETVGSESGEFSTLDVVHEKSRESIFLSRLSVRGSKLSATDECFICFEQYAKGERVCVPITPRCSHVFHEECIFEWMKKENSCPVCRQPLTADCKGVVPNV